MTHHSFPRMALLSAGIILRAGMLTIGSAAQLDNGDRLSPVEIERGLFRFEIYALPKDSGPTFLLEGTDSDLWFSDIGTHSIARFDVALQQLVSFPLPRRNSVVLVMGIGPDGNVWFGDGSYGVIWNVTHDGKFTETPMPHHTGAAGLSAGPDGNLWITEGVNDSIARYDLRTGTFEEFPLHDGIASGPCKITPGPDGAMWFTEFNGDRIVRITLDGEFTKFPVPTRNAEPFMIVAGPDGALWFTEYNSGKIGRITTSGEITEFPTSNPATFPFHMVVGPDNDIWFTETGENALGRIATSGELTEFSFGGSQTNPDGITVGEDNRIWFTQYAGNALGAVLSPR